MGGGGGKQLGEEAEGSGREGGFIHRERDYVYMLLQWSYIVLKDDSFPLVAPSTAAQKSQGKSLPVDKQCARITGH